MPSSVCDYWQWVAVEECCCCAFSGCLQNLSELELKVTNWGSLILLKNFLVEHRIHGSIYFTSRPDPEAATQQSLSHYGEMVFFWNAGGECTTSRKFHFCLTNPLDIYSKLLWIKVFLSNVRLCSFCSVVVLASELSWKTFFPFCLFHVVESWTHKPREVRPFMSPWMSFCTPGKSLLFQVFCLWITAQFKWFVNTMSLTVIRQRFLWWKRNSS